MNVLVVGKAKTGTTVISKAIHQALPGARYHLEPKAASYFEEHGGGGGSDIVKIIFEHWGGRPADRDALVDNRLAMRFDRRVFIVRDPRDEAISRLLYLAYPWMAKHGAGRDQRETLREWIGLLQRKERDPQSVGGLELFAWARERLGTDVLASTAQSAARYAAFLARAPASSFLIRYEDFVEGRIAALNEYLGLQLEPQTVPLGDLARTRRSAASGNWKSFFAASEMSTLQSLFGEACKAQGYEDWAPQSAAALDSRHFSGYVERLVESGTPTRLQRLRAVLSGLLQRVHGRPAG
ncbi:hypothetical protein [Sinimarinibacterium flocculans]|uniref:hypothetical protein n=1 Tax=Sinimarinibacterium flocculans TaxID=985250 RepID=UPI0035198707